MFKRTSNVNGTHLQGSITTTFNKLVEAFGPPCLHNEPNTSDKVTIEWKMLGDDGTIATIYDWKCYGWQPGATDVYEWHVGGHTSAALRMVSHHLANTVV